MKRIKYLSYYIPRNDNQKRNAVLSAMNKMDYICQALNNLGYDVDIISASATRDSKRCYRGKYININDRTRLKLFFTFPWGNKAQKLLSLCFMRWCVFYELMKLSKHEKVIVYHSLGYMNVVALVHRLKKFQLILEVEEIYSDVINDEKKKKQELHFFSQADSYIFPTKLLSQVANPYNKNEIIIHGTYQVEPNRFVKKFDGVETRIVHCVYAGTFDPRKGGAIAAVAAAEYLPADYHMHILGFGTEKDTTYIKKTIEEISKKSVAKITYEGLLSGEEYIKFIQSCDIGLSTQDPDADFNATSFPSKILSYLANGLRVVSIKIPAIETSAIANKIYFYSKQTPQDIATTILNIDIDSKYDSRKLIHQLSKQFETNLRVLLEGKV